MPENGSVLSDAKRRIIDHLKRVDTATASDLATAFGLTDTAIRQHLDVLESSSLVVRHMGTPVGRGRPPVNWKLSDTANELFPDRHADLTVELIRSIEEALGHEALQAVVRQRAARQLVTYQRALGPTTDVRVRVRKLAELRTAEGYLADVTTDGDALVLTEHHCPIHDAATSCVGLCGAELALFQDALGEDLVVTRIQHLLAGDARCAYRITAA